ncbi:MAG: hypothetical protein JNM66_25260 [Bryobacterales bacterium]|nr:hypothetical protein [Bryobacterales bacterium]
MPPALILADDATGALECASLLSAYSRRSVRVIDTQSRHLSPAHAAAAIRPYAQTPILYKKTDSALRGNIAAELESLLPRTVVYIPAYPNLGRTVHNGHLFIHGVPIHQTDFARDPRHPVTSSRVASLFSQSISIPAPHALAEHLSQPAILICDAATNHDLTQLALSLQHANAVVASPAGFLPHWAPLQNFKPASPPSVPAPTRWLVLCGSLHPQSLRQAQHARSLTLAVLQTPLAPQPDPDAVAAQFAHHAKLVIEQRRPNGIIVMGGDTVFALWHALGVTEIVPLPERLPGVAASWSPQLRILFLTKAGGFGGDTLVEQILDTFK